MLGITSNKKNDAVATDEARKKTEAVATDQGRGRSEAAAADESQPALPLLDVYENDNEFLLVADLPGVPQEGAAVTLEQNRLVIQANGSIRKYRRELIVPPSVDADKVAAAMKAGVLTVHLPKRAPYQPRQIQVRSA